MSKSYDHIARLLQIKTMKEAYLPDLNEIYQRVTAKLQQVSYGFFTWRIVCIYKYFEIVATSKYLMNSLQK